MALPKRKKPSVAQVLKLADKLSPVELTMLRNKLDNKTWGDELEALFSRIDARNKDLPPLSEKEILAAVKAIREDLRAERAQSSR